LAQWDRRDQQVAIVGSSGVHCVIDNDLIFRFPQLERLAELVGLAGFAFANDFRRRLEHAEDFAFSPCIAVEDALPRLVHDASDERQHLLKILPQVFLGEPFCLSDHVARGIQQSAITLLPLLVVDRTFRTRDLGDLEQPQLHTATAVAELGSNRRSW
jgi:hypothetical protein